MAIINLYVSATQTIADGFITVPINTGLTSAGGAGYRLVQISAELPFLNNVQGSNVEFALSRANKTVAIPNILDDDILYKDKRYCAFNTSGGNIQDLISVERPADDILIIEEQIFLLFDSALTTIINSIQLKLTMETVKVSTDQRLSILQSRLN